MLVFARLSKTFGYNVLMYAIEVLAVLPIKDIRDAKDKIRMYTPYEFVMT
jgi:hypothetical protein